MSRVATNRQIYEHASELGGTPGSASGELQLTEEYKAQLNPPAASVSTRVHNAFVAGYRNASETVLGIALFFAEYGPALLIWLMILVLPVIFVWRRYRKALATA